MVTGPKTKPLSEVQRVYDRNAVVGMVMKAISDAAPPETGVTHLAPIQTKIWYKRENAGALLRGIRICSENPWVASLPKHLLTHHLKNKLANTLRKRSEHEKTRRTVCAGSGCWETELDSSSTIDESGRDYSQSAPSFTDSVFTKNLTSHLDILSVRNISD